MKVSVETVRLSDIQQGPIQHESLPEDLMPRIEATYRAIGHYQCPSLEQWELGFMGDMIPEGEVAIWEVLAKAFQLFKQKCWKGKRLRREEAKSIISTLSLISMGQPLAMIKGNGVVKRQLLQCYQNVSGFAKPLVILKT